MENSNRRGFLRGAGRIAAAASAQRAFGQPRGRGANIFLLANTTHAKIDEPVERAAASLARTLRESGMAGELRYNLDTIHEDAERIVIAPAASTVARQVAH